MNLEEFLNKIKRVLKKITQSLNKLMGSIELKKNNTNAKGIPTQCTRCSYIYVKYKNNLKLFIKKGKKLNFIRNNC
ncbi:hypothetical protein [Hathewaya massiliensis]|uniref:hypothetical protein n=1 Tax=Hathewaya massiliensis TaxID=1964382 RepID=UPI001159773C|nr:hypothetical protein [Hathewaya massiliensis]